MIAQVAQTSMGFVDTLMSGHYSSTDLAAVSLGSGIWLPLFIASQGILIATTPLVAHKVGSDEMEQTRAPFQQGAVLAAIITLLAMTALQNSSSVLVMINVADNLTQITSDYLFAISWGFPALLGYQLLRSYIEGFGKTQPAMIIAIVGLLCNIPLNYIFIYGKLGFPEMGGVGCGWATSVVMWIMLTAAVIYVLISNTFRQYSPFEHWAFPALSELRDYLKLGLPIGFSLLIEVSMFSIIALLLADLGEVMIASHQVTLSFTGLVFMLPLSISMALTIRIGHILGQGDPNAARFSAKVGLLITLSIAIVSSTLMAIYSQQVAELYTQDTRIIEVATTLIIIAAIFQFSDAIQVTSSGALRGYKDTAVPLMLVFISYWLIGLPIGYLLGKTDILTQAMGPQGFWIGLLIGLTIGAILLVTRLHLKSRSQIQN